MGLISDASRRQSRLHLNITKSYTWVILFILYYYSECQYPRFDPVVRRIVLLFIRSFNVRCAVRLSGLSMENPLIQCWVCRRIVTWFTRLFQLSAPTDYQDYWLLDFGFNVKGVDWLLFSLFAISSQVRRQIIRATDGCSADSMLNAPTEGNLIYSISS